MRQVNPNPGPDPDPKAPTPILTLSLSLSPTAVPAAVAPSCSGSRRRRLGVALTYADEGAALRYHRPATLSALHALLRMHPEAQLVCGNTGMGVSKYYTADGPTGVGGLPAQRDATLVDYSAVPELGSVAVDRSSGALIVGAAVSLQTLQAALLTQAAAVAADGAMPDGTGGAPLPTAAALARQIGRIATTQVRAVGSWAGNLAIAAAAPAFASDLATALSAVGATLSVVPRRATEATKTNGPSGGVGGAECVDSRWMSWCDSFILRSTSDRYTSP